MVFVISTCTGNGCTIFATLNDLIGKKQEKLDFSSCSSSSSSAPGRQQPFPNHPCTFFFFCSHCKIWLLPWWRRPCSAVYLFRNSVTGSVQKISVVLLWLAVWELECVGFGVLIACCCERRWSCGARSLCPKQRLTSRTSLASTYHSLRHHRGETQNWQTVDPTPEMQFSEKCSQSPVFHSHCTAIYKQHRRTT